MQHQVRRYERAVWHEAGSFFTFGEPGIFYLIASFLVRRVNILIKLFE
jgi:hypothetical protein